MILENRIMTITYRDNAFLKVKEPSFWKKLFSRWSHWQVRTEYSSNLINVPTQFQCHLYIFRTNGYKTESYQFFSFLDRNQDFNWVLVDSNGETKPLKIRNHFGIVNLSDLYLRDWPNRKLLDYTIGS